MGGDEPPPPEVTAPEAPMYIEAFSLREVCAEVSFSFVEPNRDQGHLTLRMSEGRATGGVYMIDVKGSARSGLHDGNGVRVEESVCLNFLAASMEPLVALYFGLGMLLKRARHAGWHDIGLVHQISGDTGTEHDIELPG